LSSVAGSLRVGERRPQIADRLGCEFVSSAERLNELERDWRELWSSLHDATPFQSPDWLLPWWKQYGEGELFSFAFWRGGKLVGLAPLYIYTANAEPRRKLFLLGTGNSDYLDVIFDSEFDTECWKALVREIKNRSACWDVCSFQRLRPRSPILEESVNESGLRAEVGQQVPCVAVDLHDLGHGEVQLRRSHTYARKLQGVHSFTFEEAKPETLGDFSEALERLHQQRWHQEGYQGALSSARERSFHREIARRFLNAKMLMFYGLRMSGALVAVIYGYRIKDRIYSYLSGFDPQYARQSVGTISVGYAIERAMQNGCHGFDFLQGREPYKYTWGARDLPCYAKRIVKA
jgi:CelD/BcsL family acetyltransferase involved in cellulose biosynthesis